MPFTSFRSRCAHIDLNRRHDEGLRVNDRDLRKHRADVAKLAGLLTPDARLGLRRQMRRDAEDFLDDFERYAARHTQRKHRRRLQETLVFLRGHICRLETRMPRGIWRAVFEKRPSTRSGREPCADTSPRRSGTAAGQRLAFAGMHTETSPARLASGLPVGACRP